VPSSYSSWSVVELEATGHREPLEALVAPDAVALVDEVVAGRELREIADAAEQRVLGALALLRRVVRALAEDLRRGVMTAMPSRTEAKPCAGAPWTIRDTARGCRAARRPARSGHRDRAARARREGDRRGLCESHAMTTEMSRQPAIASSSGAACSVSPNVRA